MKLTKKHIQKKRTKLRRKKHIRKYISGSKEYPRLSVFRSIKNISIQIIDDEARTTILALSSFSKCMKQFLIGHNKSKTAFIIGKEVGKLLIEQGINKVAFDRNGFKYTGRVAKLADGIRSTGIYV